jgi:hypothetical protein
MSKSGDFDRIIKLVHDKAYISGLLSITYPVDKEKRLQLAGKLDGLDTQIKAEIETFKDNL